MSQTIDFFFRSSLSLGEIATYCAEELGLAFSKVGGKEMYYQCHFLRHNTFLSAHRFTEIENYNVTGFNHHLQLGNTSAGNTVSDIISFVMLTHVFLTERLAEEGVLFYDCQVTLAKYVFSDGKWTDDLSATDVQLPRHAEDVYRRWAAVYRRQELPEPPTERG